MTNESPRYIFELEMKVRDYEIDSQGIVNNANYLHYLEHTRHEFCEQFGISFCQMQQQGIDPVVNHIDISYLTPLRLAEKFRSCLWLERRGPRFVFHQDIYNSRGAKVVAAKVSVVELDHGTLTRGDTLASIFASALDSTGL